MILAAVASLILVLISVLLAKPGSTYQWSFVFLVPLVWAVYVLQDRLLLRPWHFALFILAIVIHDLGTFGFYRRSFLGLRFDSYVHFLFGFVAGLILFRAASGRLSLSRSMLVIGVPIFILGVGGIHEMFECFTTILLGPERGMLKLHPDQPFDTQKDLLNNFLGAVLAVVLSVQRWAGLADLGGQTPDRLKPGLHTPSRNEGPMPLSDTVSAGRSPVR